MNVGLKGSGPKDKRPMDGYKIGFEGNIDKTWILNVSADRTEGMKDHYQVSAFRK